MSNELTAESNCFETVRLKEICSHPIERFGLKLSHKKGCMCVACTKYESRFEQAMSSYLATDALCNILGLKDPTMVAKCGNTLYKRGFIVKCTQQRAWCKDPYCKYVFRLGKIWYHNLITKFCEFLNFLGFFKTFYP